MDKVDRKVVLFGIISICAIILFVTTHWGGGAIDDPPPTVEASPKVVPISLPKASKAAMSKRGHWALGHQKNPVTGEVSKWVSEDSKYAMYNQYASSGEERVTLVIACDADSVPSMSMFGHFVLRGDGSGNLYRAPVRIGDSVVNIRWGIGKDDDAMFDLDSETDNVVQKLQTASRLIVTYSAVDEGEQYATFDLTGLRTAMTKAGCAQLTSG